MEGREMKKSSIVICGMTILSFLVITAINGVAQQDDNKSVRPGYEEKKDQPDRSGPDNKPQMNPKRDKNKNDPEMKHREPEKKVGKIGKAVSTHKENKKMKPKNDPRRDAPKDSKKDPERKPEEDKYPRS